MKTTFLLAFVLLDTVVGEDQTATSKPLTFGNRTQLFVDDYIVSRKTNVKRFLGTVKKENGGKPVFPDGRFYGTVLHDDGKFRLWYRQHGKRGYGYAESNNGIHFEKKGLLKGIPFAGDINLSVMIDPHDKDPQHRFKGSFDAVGMAAGIVHSGDGIHWTTYNNGRPVTYRAADTYNFLSWDEDARLYRLFTRTDFGQGGGPFANTVAKDFEVRGTRTMTSTDFRANPTKWNLVRHWHFNKVGSREYRRRQVYAITDWIRHGVHFGLMTIYEWPSDFSEGKQTNQHRRHERDVMNFYIGTSRDANNWDMTWVYAGKPIIPRGPDGAWDKDMLMPASSIATHDDKHWLYYGGSNERHGDPSVKFERTQKIGVATIGLDRLIGVRSDDSGIVETKPFRFDGDQLVVNINAHKGSLRVEILDEEGEPLSGLSGRNAATATKIDNLRFVPQWKTACNLESLSGKIVHLRFTLKNASLYSFQVKSR